MSAGDDDAFSGSTELVPIERPPAIAVAPYFRISHAMLEVEIVPLMALAVNAKLIVEVPLAVDSNGESMSEIAGNAAVAFEYPKEAIISYAQTHEDVLLWRALHSVGAGFYVDVGAHDPTDLSVTRAFYERGWRGINIEPNPGYAKKLREQRPRDVTLEVALGDQHGETTIYDFGATGLSTIVTEIAKDHLSTGLQPVEFQVPLTTLATALADLRDQEIHFLKIDVEGYERQVLSGADFKRHRPWIVLLEAVRPMTSIPTYSAWEPILLNAGYQFAYFDGLNRFYVSEEHSDLKRYFSVPVNINDPFRDYQVVSLSSTVAALERDKMKHEVPRLGSDPRVSDPTDATGLLWIVETQASDLVRLRRALLAQRSNAAERNDAEAPAPEPEVAHWIRSIALADLRRTQAAIDDIIERTGWRRLGQRLGLEKQLDWEAGYWKSNLVNTKDDNSEAATPALGSLLFEVKRMRGLLDELARSRWIKLGHWLGFAQYSLSRSDLYRDPLLLEDFPPEAKKELPDKARTKASPSSYEGFVELTNQRFLDECREFSVDVIFDIGANTGQFVSGLRDQGCHGHIVSFEPLSDAYAALVASAADDPLWDVAERCAIGAADGWAEINIAGNSYSSSLLPMLDLHREAAPQSEYQGKEPCRVITLDSYIEGTFSDPTTQFAVKIDTQGYEAEVLAGLKRNHHRVKVILCEMSVAPLYAQGPSMSELCHLLAGLNYRCVALTPEFEDPRTGELLQTNGIFVKRD